MKKYIYLVLGKLLLLQFFLPTQLTSQRLHYACIEYDRFLLGINKNEGYKTSMVKIFRIKKPFSYSNTYTPIILNSYFPFSWKSTEEKIFMIQGYGNFPRQGHIYIMNYKIEARDSITVLKQKQLQRKMLEEKYSNPKELDMAVKRQIYEESQKLNKRDIKPIIDWYRANSFHVDNFHMYDVLIHTSYDFIPSGDNLFKFIIRTDKELTVWKFHYPPLGEESEAINWEEVITYSSDSTYSPPVKRRDSDVLPSGEKHVFNAIQDTSFFRGHFKAIMQEKHLYLINVDHGGIYLVSDKSIDKIGQLKDLESYPTWIFNKKVFIEDKDNKRLIFFTEVEQLRKDLPFPDVLIIKDKQVYEKYFPYIP